MTPEQLGPAPNPTPPGPVPDPVAAPARARTWSDAFRAVGGYLALAAGLGALGGLVWRAVVRLPTYLVGTEGGASTSERGLAAVIGADAWFCVVGAVVGLALGVIAWWRFGRLGWAVVPLTVFAAAAAGLLCWGVGTATGRAGFADRLAVAPPGAQVPVDLELQARASLLVWPFVAIIPVLLGSSLGRDEEDPRTASGAAAADADAAPGPG